MASPASATTTGSLARVHIAHDRQEAWPPHHANNARNRPGHVHIDDWGHPAAIPGASVLPYRRAHVTLPTEPSSCKTSRPSSWWRPAHRPSRTGSIPRVSRRGFSSEAITALKRAYRTPYKSGLDVEAARQTDRRSANQPDVRLLVEFPDVFRNAASFDEGSGREVRIALGGGRGLGDLLASHLLAALRDVCRGRSFFGIGGPRMRVRASTPGGRRKACGEGLFRGLAALPRNCRHPTIEKRLLADPPDVLSASMRRISTSISRRPLKRRGIRTIHYISPPSGPGGEDGSNRCTRRVDKVLALFPWNRPSIRRQVFRWPTSATPWPTPSQ